MEAFTTLFNQLEQTKSTSEKVALIRAYFETSNPSDSVWALFFLSGYRLKRLITGRMLFEWCQESLQIPEWLMVESYSAVGDKAETISLLMLNTVKTPHPMSLSQWMEERILPLQGQESGVMKQQILAYWKELDSKGIFLLNKILSGSLRIGVSHLLTIQGLSQALQVSKETLSQKLMGTWTPSSAFFESLREENDSHTSLNPYPFYLASPVEEPLDALGDPREWVGEWKWDGIRAQGIHRKGEVALWSRGNELVTSQFPEIAEALLHIPENVVLDGEILAFKEGRSLPFGELQKRLGRKKISASLLSQVPLVLMIYDLLEWEGHDSRSLPFTERRHLLETHLTLSACLQLSPLVIFNDWETVRKKRDEALNNGTEGLILKKKDSSYGVGRKRGQWWKYKTDPQTVDAILMYAQTGHGWRANLYTDYTFGVWHQEELVPIAKAYSGLTQEEIVILDRWIRKHIDETFGPVRKVKPELVFEIAFEGIQASKRHKSGIAFRFPRILRQRNDKTPQECDSLENIKKQFLY